MGGFDRKDSFYNSNLNETADFDAKFQLELKSDLEERERGALVGVHRHDFPPVLGGQNTIYANQMELFAKGTNEGFRKPGLGFDGQLAIGVGNQAQI